MCFHIINTKNLSIEDILIIEASSDLAHENNPLAKLHQKASQVQMKNELPFREAKKNF